ncbi:probably inactive leucine-rich repeat receptor-like protein kinase At5g48380 isoform X2 [Ziziphus jujuba]|uniref:Probably inactive leucine-rich repeat receptor-like protein kinase At5g48380 isoform X2 n=1 Tax=Ziziphus jujuba TaxID=326968 RepID=A0ABM4A3N9_ZIZJJ|nr:probably inactive leucine-rich repeat receptor-like protein kinase At5g48380 isoform X2 [Ziziphus jujuba]
MGVHHCILEAWCVMLCILSCVTTNINGSRETSHEYDDDDIHCLKSIKMSLQDPHGYLLSWNFDQISDASMMCNLMGISCWMNRDDHDKYLRVREIRLSKMGLKGRFPLGLESCSYMELETLDLSFNNLSGSIPSHISTTLPSISNLDLSHNRFSGQIPTHIANCLILTVLKLNDNQLSGPIPSQLGLLTRLTLFTVTNNQGLCGAPSITPCTQHHHLFQDFKDGFFIGYEVSAVFVTTGFTCYYCLLWFHLMKRKNRAKLSSPLRKKNNRTTQANYQISESQKWVARMSFGEISKGTNNFSKDNKIGTGKMGTMYKAVLDNGCSIAVKRLNNSPLQDMKFINEIKTLGRIRHPNLVPLLGFCIKGPERILVYKYMSNGNLYDWLHGVEDKVMIMEWPLRVKIAVGLARGLAWLHHDCNFRTVHVNISSNSILLDENFEPKISDFRGEVLMDPNHTNSKRSMRVHNDVQEMDILKKDAYSFGTVLLELITLKKRSQMSSPCSSTQEESLGGWVSQLLRSCASDEIYQGNIDKCLIGKGLDGEIIGMLRIAAICVQPFPVERPTMLQVYQRLSVIGERYGITHDFRISRQPDGEIVEIG